MESGTQGDLRLSRVLGVSTIGELVRCCGEGWPTSRAGSKGCSNIGYYVNEEF